MFTQLSDVAKRYLATPRGEKFVFTRFAAGKYTGSLIDFNNVEYNSEDTFLSENLVTLFVEGYSTTASSMVFNEISNSKCDIKVQIPEQSPYFNVNMVVFYASTETLEEFPFIICYTLIGNPKFSTTTNKYGTNYHFILQLDIVDRLFRYDFSNMARELPEFAEVDFLYDLKKAQNFEMDQFILRNHINLAPGSRVFTLNSEEEYYGVILEPHMVDSSKIDIVLTE